MNVVKLFDVDDREVELKLTPSRVCYVISMVCAVDNFICITRSYSHSIAPPRSAFYMSRIIAYAKLMCGQRKLVLEMKDPSHSLRSCIHGLSVVQRL
jgi:hypothetical protein